MISVTVIALGKLKESYMRDFCAEYEKRLKAFCKINITELSPVRLSQNPSEGEIKKGLDSEAALIKSKIPSSVDFSEKISATALSGKSNIAFIIGSSFGLSNEIKKMSDFKFSMSEMTFPHQLARCMLLEQIYRAFEISSGGKYHK